MHHDHLVRAEDIRRVLDIAQVSQIGADQRILHLIPRHYAVEGQDAVQNPIGMHAFKLESETHVITTSVSSVQDLVKCIRSVDVEVEDLVFAGLASSNAVLTEDDKQAGTILADIGGGTVEISVFKDGSIWHTAVIPAGGFQVTEDISVGLNLPFEVAEELKKKYGAVPPVSDDKPDNDTIIMSGQKISHKQLYDIIRARAEELLRLIIIDLPKDEKGVVVPGGLVLTGGGANLAGIDILGSEVLKMPVRVNRPLNFYSAGDQLNDPAYATVIGLLMWGLKPKSNGK
jgi:cell division protein FtsA